MYYFVCGNCDNGDIIVYVGVGGFDLDMVLYEFLVLFVGLFKV